MYVYIIMYYILHMYVCIYVHFNEALEQAFLLQIIFVFSPDIKPDFSSKPDE